MSASDYLLIAESDICPQGVVDDTGVNVTRVAWVHPNPKLVQQVLRQKGGWPTDKILVIGTELLDLVNIYREVGCSIGLLLEEEGQRVTFIENGFYFYGWQELLDILNSELVQQMMSEERSVREVLLALRDKNLA